MTPPKRIRDAKKKRCSTCDGRGWSLATYSRMGGTYLRFCECETGDSLKDAVETRERRRKEGREA